MKRTRKPTPRQVDPETKAKAILLKKSGLLSKRTNLRKKAVSRHVVKQVENLDWALKNNYHGVKVKPVLARAAREQGLETKGNIIIVPRDGRSKKRLEQNIITGIRPIPGGNMVIVNLPYSTMTEFLIALRKGEVDRFKGPDELFAFSFYGHQSIESFRNGKELLKWVLKYDSITNPITGSLLTNLDKVYSNFILYKVSGGAFNPRSFEEKLQEKNERREAYRNRDDTRYEKRRGLKSEQLSARALENKRTKQEIKSRNKRANMSNAERAEYSRKGAERVKRSRQRKRNKPE